jgi:hypothetical protein
MDVSLTGALPNARDELAYLTAYLPKDVAFEDAVWDLHSWGTVGVRRTKFQLDLGRIAHREVAAFVRQVLLHRRKVGKIQARYGHSHLLAGIAWGNHLAARRMLDTRGDDFAILAERMNLRQRQSLEMFRDYLESWYGHVLPPLPKESKRVGHGVHGTDEGRAQKLIPDQVLADLLSLRNSSDLTKLDRVMVNAIAINVACGFRINELLHLPQDCLVEDEGCLYIRNHTSKKGREAPRLVPKPLESMVRTAIADLQAATDKGRAIAAGHAAGGVDWDAVLAHPKARPYFVRKWVAEWVANPEHALINPDAAWSNAKSMWIDAIAAIKIHGGSTKAAAALGIEWNTFNSLVKQQESSRAGRLYLPKGERTLKQWKRDPRIVSPTGFARAIGHTHGKVNGFAQDVIDTIEEGGLAQIELAAFPPPPVDEEMESRFAKRRPVRLFHENGQPKLHVDEMLFVFELYELSDFKSSQGDRYRFFEPSDVIHWLAGQKSGEHPQPSVFERHRIIDARTEEPASFRSHDIRHWLNTTYQKGGLSQSQVSVLFNRLDTKGNSPYNHTSNLERRERLKEQIRAGFVGGTLSQAYARLSDINREEAEAHLDAYTRQVNIMPHGLCTKDLASEPCPHHLSCFSCDDAQTPEEAKPCPFLSVDFLDPQTVPAVQQVQANARTMVERLEDIGAEDGPQGIHFRKILHSTTALLAQNTGHNHHTTNRTADHIPNTGHTP